MNVAGLNIPLGCTLRGVPTPWVEWVRMTDIESMAECFVRFQQMHPDIREKFVAGALAFQRDGEGDW